jgi:hypothetical protein
MVPGVLGSFGRFCVRHIPRRAAPPWSFPRVGLPWTTILAMEQGARMPMWFTVRLADRPGSLARLALALADRGVNITGIVGVAEDTDGSLMLTTSDPIATRAVLAEIDVAFEEHDSAEPGAPSGMASVRQGLADRGLALDR